MALYFKCFPLCIISNGMAHLMVGLTLEFQAVLPKEQMEPRLGVPVPGVAPDIYVQTQIPALLQCKATPGDRKHRYKSVNVTRFHLG